MNQPTTPDLSGYGAQVIKESGRFALTFWPYCTKCQSPFQFDAEEPFAYCSCGTTEWVTHDLLAGFALRASR